MFEENALSVLLRKMNNFYGSLVFQPKTLSYLGSPKQNTEKVCSETLSLDMSGSKHIFFIAAKTDQTF